MQLRNVVGVIGTGVREPISHLEVVGRGILIALLVLRDASKCVQGVGLSGTTVISLFAAVARLRRRIESEGRRVSLGRCARLAPGLAKGVLEEFPLARRVSW